MSTRLQHRHLYAGNYQRRAKAVTRTAYLNPDTQCARCGKTLAEHPPTKSGRQPKWHAGHAWPNDPNAPLRPEVESCNVAEGNDRRRGNPHSETW